MIDNLTPCKVCGSKVNIEAPNPNGITFYSCFGCGYSSHSEMKEGSEMVQENESHLPYLMRDLRKVVDGIVYYPQVLNVPEGMVFPEGSSINDWKWTAVKKIPLTEEELKESKTDHRIDVDNKVGFDSFIEAYNYIML